MHVSSAAALAVLTWALTFGVARAEPTLEIRSRAVLELHGARADDGIVRVRAVLTDDVGAPMRGATIAVDGRVAGASCDRTRSCRTRRDGTCDVVIEGCNADAVAGRFDGNESTDGAEVVAQVVDHGAEPRVRITVDGGDAVDLDARTVRVSIAIDGIASVPARVTLADELGRVILHRSIAAEPSSALVLAPRELGPPGLGSLVATVRFEDGSEASGRVMIARRTHARLVLRRQSDSLVARLVDGFGPVSGAIVGLRIDDEPARDARTDSNGRVRFAIETSDDERIAFATFHSNDGARTDATSNRLRLARKTIPYLRLALPFATLALLALVVLRRATKATPRASRPERRPEPSALEIGEATALLPTATDIALRVVAREDDRPLVASAAPLVSTFRFELGEDGRLHAENVPSGVHTVVVQSVGRPPEVLKIRVPHRGEWSNARVRLETARAFARRAIPIVAHAAASNDDESEVLTVREADERLDPSTDTAFRGDVEDAIYGAVDPTVAHAESIVARSRSRAGNV